VVPSAGAHEQAVHSIQQTLARGNEYRYLAEAIEEGHISGDGRFTRLCHALLEQELGVRKVLLTTSCTHALEMAALLLRIQPGTR